MTTPKTKKGAILVFTLIILGIALVVAMSLATGTVFSVRSSIVVDDSATAFQVADTGAERSFLKLIKEQVNAIQDIGSCANGKVTVSGPGSLGSGSKYVLEFRDANGNAITDCTTTTDKVRIGYSTGYFGKAVRKVEFSIPEREKGLIGWWRLDEASGNGALDSSTTKNDGQLYGGFTRITAAQDAKSGSAVYFDGSNDYGVISHNTKYKLRQGTISFWIKPENSGSYRQGVFTKGSSNTGDGWFSVVTTSQNSKIEISLVDKWNPGSADFHIGPTSITAGSWNHIVVTFDGPGNSTWSLYVNGVRKARESDSSNVRSDKYSSGIYNNADDIRVGESNCSVCGIGDDFKGIIDDIKMYDYTMSDADVTALYNKY